MTLTPDQIAALSEQLPEWTIDGGTLVREFVFASFPDAVAFVTRLAFDAEAADHHPDLRISYRRVTVAWTTHSAGGLTPKDIEGARQTEALAAQWVVS